jgi:pyridoxamine 5'-phosphate oxidase
MTINPLEQLDRWLTEERSLGNPFAHGAVLGTQGEDGMPHTRMLGVSFDRQKIPKFHTSPVSRKVQDINLCNSASLTFAFQQTMRSVSLEGLLEPLPDRELDADWNKLDREFRRNYLGFGDRSGTKIADLQELRIQQDRLPRNAEEHRPVSFIGYTFKLIQRICFYSVAIQDFANCELYEFNPVTQSWISSLRVP